MDLILWRHAEAEDGTPDLKRKLTARGEKQARQMAEWIKQHAPKNLRIIASPAVRTQQTAQALGMPFSTDKRLGTDAGVPGLLAAVDWPDRKPNGRSRRGRFGGFRTVFGLAKRKLCCERWCRRNLPDTPTR